MAKVRIIGAGFSGLTLAYYLKARGVDVEIYEQNPDVGGLIHTLPHPKGLVETAANALIWSPTVQSLFDDLGLEVTPTLPESKQRYIFLGGVPRRWPLNLTETLTLACKALKALVFKNSREPRAGETVAAYIQRVLTRPALEKLAAPGLQGIYAGDVYKMSARLLFGRFAGNAVKDCHNLEYKKQKFKARGSVSPKHGMGSLIVALKKHLQAKGVEFYFGATPNDSAAVTVWATSVWSASQALKTQAPELAARLGGLETSGLVTATLFYPKAAARLKGFGVLFKPGEGVRALGVLFNEMIFPHRSQEHSENWIMGGAHDPDVQILTDEEILKSIKADRIKLLGKDDSFLGFQITRWPKALPQYNLNLEQTLDTLKVPAGIYLHGNYLGRIGLAQILERSRLLADKIAETEKL